MAKGVVHEIIKLYSGALVNTISTLHTLVVCESCIPF